MGFLNKVIVISVAWFAFYTTYLTTYKCPKIEGLFLNRASNALVHPFSHHHNWACEQVNTASNFLTPYGTKAHAWLDANVHSTEFFKKHDIEKKLHSHFNTVHSTSAPYLQKFWQYVELLEYHLATHFHNVYTAGLKHFSKNVSPKLEELKGHVSSQAESVASKVSELKDSLTSQAATVVSNVKSLVDTQVKAASEAVGSVAGSVAAKAEEVVSEALSVATSAYAEGQKSALEAVSAAESVASDASSTVKSAASDASANVESVVSNASSNVKSAASVASSNAKSVVVDASSNAESVIEDANLRVKKEL